MTLLELKLLMEVIRGQNIVLHPMDTIVSGFIGHRGVVGCSHETEVNWRLRGPPKSYQKSTVSVTLLELKLLMEVNRGPKIVLHPMDTIVSGFIGHRGMVGCSHETEVNCRLRGPKKSY